jgi:hypothetical protein
MTTSQYVYTYKDLKNESNGSYKISLSEEINRIPNKTIEIIAASVEIPHEHSAISIRCDLQPTNYFSDDGYGPSLSILQNNVKTGATWNYSECGFEQPRYVINNTNNFYISFLYGASQTIVDDPPLLPIVDITNFTIIFKITYPEQGAINKQYTNEIQRPGLRPYL